MRDLGIVLIGRNEGNRLRRCLESVVGCGCPVVYVDSGSTDGSAQLAHSFGAQVVELDLTTPFTAARARNAGVARLVQMDPPARYIQFVDGDCELVPGWLERGLAELEAQPRVAVVCGRLRERHPERSIYNRLADMEWDTPVGEVAACGGIFIIRQEAFRGAGGFDPTLLAGEEPDLCLRLRRLGWTIRRVEAEMALHDMAMTRFGQWWRRCIRGGYGYAEGAARHGRSEERHWIHETRSILAWGLLMPLAALVLAWPSRGLSLLLLVGYPILFQRIRRRCLRRGLSPADGALYAASCTLAKFPQAIGALRYWLSRLARQRPGQSIEFKVP